ncbi:MULTISPECIES: ABC transporter ATP-binding protein [unclassified Exiguobacterium]|uniref:ABC transporter ATP-binding protein n=1 Tax=unclassified Exiguobacterium TaxID=2644629 RepID=UPI000B58F35E|nr:MULTISPECIES: ABC transporter ATP-binding protein [unclassified Exiguobacterium]ASI35453.1 lipoprotein-releasing system ATP-binding protein LolD [Exiguobacterium sp. N4-1P]ASI37466.1 lipoprotein-releasing system ATP-binding protein LolD [Exiguobacterium sp. N4-1P]
MKDTFQCQDIGKSFSGDGIETKALDAVNLTLDAGDFISIIGPSGSGKSTLLSLIGTLDRPTTGQLLYGDRPINQLKSKELSDFRFENVGFIFQQFHLIPTLTALENVMAPLFGRKVSYDKKERALALLDQVGLAEKASSLPSQLSGGQQQRVAVARALVHEPKWLLADEPTGNLDTETGEIIFQLLKRLNAEKGCGVLFVTHDPELADRANRKIEMKDGLVIEDSRLVTV